MFGVRGDLVMKYETQPPQAFPEGYALSGTVSESFLLAEFDLRLVPLG
ncbi:MAG: hypothetical protein VW619_06860 [Rhodobiaceae bacterium]